MLQEFLQHLRHITLLDTYTLGASLYSAKDETLSPEDHSPLVKPHICMCGGNNIMVGRASI